LAIDKSPTDIDPPQREMRNAHWVKPTLVGEVRFTGWTEDGVLRHPAFIALRSDKPAGQIRRETPVAPERVTRKSAMKPRTAAAKAAPEAVRRIAGKSATNPRNSTK